MTLLHKDLEGRLDEVVGGLKGYIYDTLLEWTDFDPDGQISFVIDSKFNEAEAALTHLIEAYTEDMVVAEKDKLLKLAKECVFDDPSYSAEIMNFTLFKALLKQQSLQLKSKKE